MMILLILVLILLFISGAPLFAVMIGGAALGALASVRGFETEFSFSMIDWVSLGTNDRAAIFATIPLFIYAGYVMAASKTADRLVRFSNAALGWMPGGLAVVTILASAVFTTFTGASGVTIVALGGLLMPALIKQKYPERFSLGLITGTGSVGLLFPPALPLFVYGAIYGLQDVARKYAGTSNEWFTERFMYAGVVPGLVLVTALSIVAVIVAIKKKLPRQKFELGELGRSFVAAAPEVALPLLVIGLLASGKANVPEVAALTVVYLIVLELVIYRDIKPKQLWTVSAESMALTGTIFLVIFASTAFTAYLTQAKVPDALVAWTRDHVDSAVLFLIMLNVLLLVVGMMMDIFSAIVIVVPLIAPSAAAYGIGPYHLGVIFLINLELGYLTPPVGLNLFISSFKFRKPVQEVVRATLPFMGAMFVSLLIVTYVPALTVVPEAKRRATIGALRQLVTEAADKLGADVREVTLVDEEGKPIPGPDGKPILKRIEECDALRPIEKKTECVDMFVKVAQCRKAPTEGMTAQECEWAEISIWVDLNMDVDLVDDDDEEDEDEDEGDGDEAAGSAAADTESDDADEPDADSDDAAAGSAAGANPGSGAGG
ncbi:MAG: TRAP transporter large permease [Kofleriaceae bacterium]